MFYVDLFEKTSIIMEIEKEKIMVIPEEKELSQKVEEYVLKKGGSYIDAVLYICEENDIDPEVAGKFLTKPIKEKLETEGRELNLLKNKKAKLPF